MDKKMFMWIILIGCMRINIKPSLKYFALMIALMDNFNQGTGKRGDEFNLSQVGS